MAAPTVSFVIPVRNDAMRLRRCLESIRADATRVATEIIVAGGCFWCVEADFEKVRGVSGEG